MIRRSLITCAALIALAVPALALAADFRTGGDSYTLPRAETVSRDLYVASGTTTIHGTVRGDLFIAGGQVRVDGEVTGDIFAAGGNITIAGRVGESLRVAGGDVTLDGNVARNVSVAAGSLTTTDRSVVKGDLDVAGGQVSLAGTSGPVQVGVGTLEVLDTARVNGNLDYTSDQDARVEHGSVVSGTVTHHTPPKKQRESALAAFIGFHLFWWLGALAAAYLWLWLLPAKAAAVAAGWRQRFPGSLLSGLVGLIAIPVVALVLLVTFVGIPLGIVTILLYLALLYAATVASVIATGELLIRLVDRGRGEQVSWFAPLVGALVLFALGLVPIIGWLAEFAIWLAALGALIRWWGNFHRAQRTPAATPVRRPARKPKTS